MNISPPCPTFADVFGYGPAAAPSVLCTGAVGGSRSVHSGLSNQLDSRHQIRTQKGELLSVAERTKLTRRSGG
jgi:hypothetical protein